VNLARYDRNYAQIKSVYTERDREREIKQTKVMFRVRFRALYKRLLVCFI